jgi:hypothetical protein
MSNDKATDERSRFLEFLDRVGVGGVTTHPRRALFIKDDGDIPFSDLHVDSLSLMEIGIGLEEEYSLSLSPLELGQFTSVNALWEFAARGSSREGK